MKKKGGGGGGANWMDTYGDMVTLLLCFFVLLYSMSTISEENWKALVMSFNPDAVLEMHATPGGEGPSADSDNSGGVMPEGEEITQEDIQMQMENLAAAMKDFIAETGSESTISVTEGEGKVFISFNQSVFFDGDSAVLRKEAYPVLQSVCDMLCEASKAIDEVRVLGHTAQANPSRPNSVQVDRTLSSDRATNVIIYVQEHSDVEPARLISEGIGQWRPIASNDTVEGRAKNRRVEMIVSGRNLEEELQDGITGYEVGADEE